MIAFNVLFFAWTQCTNIVQKTNGIKHTHGCVLERWQEWTSHSLYHEMTFNSHLTGKKNIQLQLRILIIKLKSSMTLLNDNSSLQCSLAVSQSLSVSLSLSHPERVQQEHACAPRSRGCVVLKKKKSSLSLALPLPRTAHKRRHWLTGSRAAPQKPSRRKWALKLFGFSGSKAGSEHFWTFRGPKRPFTHIYTQRTNFLNR